MNITSVPFNIMKKKSMLHIVGKKKDGKKVYHARSFSQKAGVVILSDKPDFRAKKFTRDKEEHYIIIKKCTKNM